MKKISMLIVLLVILALAFPVLANEQSTPIPATLYSETVTLTDGQIQDLPTTPVLVVDGQGAGKVIVPVTLVLTSNFSNGAYTLTGGSNALGLGVTSDPGCCVALTTDPDLILTIQDDLISFIGLPTGAWLGQYGKTAADNAPLYLFQNGSDNTGGDPANTLMVTVYYYVIDL